MKIKPRITLATKFSITFVLLLIFIMFAVAYAVQESVISEFTGAYQKTLQSSLNTVESGITDVEKNIRLHLNEFAGQVSNDNEFRLYVSTLKETDNPYIVEYAPRYMKAMRLDVLEITDRRGIVLSSGHSSNPFGRSIALSVFQLRTARQNRTIMWFGNNNRRFPAVAAIDSLISGGAKYYVVGAIRIDTTLLNSINKDTTNILVAKVNGTVLTSSPELTDYLNSDNDTTLVFPPSLTNNYTQGSFNLPTFEGGSKGNAEFILLQPKRELTLLLDKLQENIFIITAVGIVIAIILSVWRTRTITKPLRQLSSEAGALSLDNLELNFHTNKKDEVGLLSNALHTMVHRLQQSRIELTAAEQKAARAEIARQVNHDLRNGFLPIRHVFEHWKEVAETEPQNLIKYFNERKVNVKESLDYLQNLSKLYTRIQPELKPEIIDINHELEKLVKSYSDFVGERINIGLKIDEEKPKVLADKIQLRRVFENILRNAVEAIEEKGKITISTEINENTVIIKCTDTGSGIPDEIKKKLFTSNITTKKEGTGLGLANVKRIIDDLDGKIKIESREGNGTTISICLQAYEKVNQVEKG